MLQLNVEEMKNGLELTSAALRLKFENEIEGFEEEDLDGDGGVHRNRFLPGKC